MQQERKQWKIGVDFFHYNNKLERVSQSTTMRITAEKFRRTSKTPDTEKQQQYQRRQK